MNVAIIRKEDMELVATIQGENIVCHKDFIAIEYPANQKQEFLEIDGKVYLHPRYKTQIERK